MVILTNDEFYCFVKFSFKQNWAQYHGSAFTVSKESALTEAGDSAYGKCRIVAYVRAYSTLLVILRLQGACT